MAPNYGEESRDPKRNVPRALYISVIGLGIFYTLTSWASLAGLPDRARGHRRPQSNAANFFFTPATQYAGHWVASVMSYLIITGSFACGMAFHNTTARYIYSLGREGLAAEVARPDPPPVEEPAHRVDHPVRARRRSSSGCSPIFTGTNDPELQAYGQLYGLMAVMGVIIILSVQALVSLSVLVYYQRYHRDEVHWWKTRLAPLLAFISQGFVVYLLFDEHHVPRGGYSYANWLGPIDAVVVLVRHRPRLLLQAVQAADSRRSAALSTKASNQPVRGPPRLPGLPASRASPPPGLPRLPGLPASRASAASRASPPPGPPRLPGLPASRSRP